MQLLSFPRKEKDFLNYSAAAAANEAFFFSCLSQVTAEGAIDFSPPLLFFTTPLLLLSPSSSLSPISFLCR